MPAYKHDFLYPHHPFHGEPTPPAVLFDANLQEFSQKVSYIVALETGAKLSSDEAYKQIKDLWKNLKQSKAELDLANHSKKS